MDLCIQLCKFALVCGFCNTMGLAAPYICKNAHFYGHLCLIWGLCPHIEVNLPIAISISIHCKTFYFDAGLRPFYPCGGPAGPTGPLTGAKGPRPHIIGKSLGQWPLGPKGPGPGGPKSKAIRDFKY